MKENNSKAFLLILLGALTAFGPLVTYMYLQPYSVFSHRT